MDRLFSACETCIGACVSGNSCKPLPDPPPAYLQCPAVHACPPCKPTSCVHQNRMVPLIQSLHITSVTLQGLDRRLHGLAEDYRDHFQEQRNMDSSVMTSMRVSSNRQLGGGVVTRRDKSDRATAEQVLDPRTRMVGAAY